MQNKWTNSQLENVVSNWQQLDQSQQADLQNYLSEKFPFSLYEKQNLMRLSALKNTESSKNILNGAEQIYPCTQNAKNLPSQAADLAGYAIVLTAGGEGERLRLSLAEKGYSEKQLHNFTKATFPLPGLPNDFGALQTNLCLIAALCKEFNLNLPVVVTTGPAGSTTAEYIPQILADYQNFGVKNLRVICQEERLHLTNEGMITADISVSPVRPVTNPDETGGPLMQLRANLANEENCLDWFKANDCSKILVLQATALYNPRMLFAMAAAGKNYDGLGVGIERIEFPTSDPYGTFVQIEKENQNQLIIVEKDIRNDKTYLLQNTINSAYLPFNTGFYVFDCAILEKGSLPDYATPPKEILPNLPKAPKIGYAATEILTLATKPAVLTVPADWFAVIKTAEDLDQLADLAVKCHLDQFIPKC